MSRACSKPTGSHFQLMCCYERRAGNAFHALLSLAVAKAVPNTGITRPNSSGTGPLPACDAPLFARHVAEMAMHLRALAARPIRGACAFPQARPRAPAANWRHGRCTRAICTTRRQPARPAPIQEGAGCGIQHQSKARERPAQGQGLAGECTKGLERTEQWPVATSKE